MKTRFSNEYLIMNLISYVYLNNLLIMINFIDVANIILMTSIPLFDKQNKMASNGLASKWVFAQLVIMGVIFFLSFLLLTCFSPLIFMSKSTAEK